MPRTFADTLRSDFAAQSSIRYFGESITYYPAGGGSRVVAAVIDDQGELRDAGRSLMDRATLFVEVSRDATDGIDYPRKGDVIVRSGDSEDRRYSYDGPDGGPQEGDSVAWNLRFVRELPYEIGGHRR